MMISRFILVFFLIASMVQMPFYQKPNSSPAELLLSSDDQQSPDDIEEIVDVATSTGLPGMLLVSRKLGSNMLAPKYSLDYGRQWFETPTIPWGSYTLSNYEIALAPREDNSPRMIVVSEWVTLYRSGDYGLSWASQYLEGNGVVSLAASPAVPQTLYVASSQLITIPGEPPTIIGYLFHSTDSGANWVKQETILEGGFSQIQPSPTLPCEVYLFFSYLGFGWSGWTSRNYCGSSASPGALPSTGALAEDAQDPQWLYTLDSYSSDGGENWNPYESLPCVDGKIFAHPTKTRVIYLLCSSGLYRSRYYGIRWFNISSLTGGILKADYSLSGCMLWIRGNTLLASSDDGTTWTNIYLDKNAFLRIVLR